ncbi:MAG: hypothetical protein KKD01_02445 [Proteobacteria bacterium]|nr:hypothetical protein [Pseudomonadota bacterium]MBU1453561.1 hypothetical protein [Pseudomonadota bacterium]
MPHLHTFQNIEISSITLSDEWNLHPFLPPDPSSRLRQSIQTIGLLHPIILKKSPGNRHQLLCGRNRLRSLQSDRHPPTLINALILDEGIEARRLLHYILEDQLLSGTLSPMEKAYFFKYCLEHMELEEAANYFFPILEENVQPHMILRVLLLLDLEAEIQKSIHLGETGEKIALELRQLTPDDRLTLHRIFQELELGGGKQKRLLALSTDLAFGQDKTITALLAEPDLTLILDHPEMNRPQKASTLLAILQKRLSPQSNTAEEIFQKTVHKMQLPAACTICHSPAFEKDEVYVTLRFDSLTEVENQLDGLKSLATGKEE